ncbi:MAG TPA: aminotransferase class III-fold pyridoxal phosphate-dependent enzyme [Pirellulales bacterium]|jgi:acetylornithine/succinyldiaminopimelate/putrescine aminotransferase/predicted amino acid dehydrogenase
MKFAFLIHPLSDETNYVLHFGGGSLQNRWGTDPVGFCRAVHEAMGSYEDVLTDDVVLANRIADEMPSLVSLRGAQAEGRLYEIPLDAMRILEEPALAMEFMEQAVEMAAQWGAKVIGLGSMTGVVGGQGTYLAERSPVPVTTGNSLTVFAAIENVHHVAEELEIDLRHETVAVVGVPGSIATACAKLLAPHCGNLILVGRRPSERASALAAELGATLEFDIPKAVARAKIVVSATSAGHCIEQSMLKPWSVVVDVAIPTDICESHATREDVLVLSGGLTQIPDCMPRTSKFLWFHHGMIPSCLAETMVLALEGRPESFSLGRSLDVEKIREIGAIAKSHGFDFSRFFSFGLPLDDTALIRFRKANSRLLPRSKAGKLSTNNRNGHTKSAAVANGRNGAKGEAVGKTSAKPLVAIEDIAPRAEKLFARHLNPVLIALGGKGGFVKTFVRGEGSYLWDAEGVRYLDFVSGFGSVNLGHNHPAVTGAVSDALRQQAPGFAQSAVNPYAAHLAETLVGIAPPDLEMVFFCNSGTESVEAALKLARKATGRAGLLHCDRSFHGKSLGALSITGNPEYQKPFGPLLPGCESIPFGDIRALARALETRRFAAFVVEPIQAEAGMIVPADDFLREAQSLCRAQGTLLIVDEVQTGMGRTGSMFAVDALDVEPDIMTVAKSLGGGLMPIGAMLCRRDLWHKAYGSLETFALHTSTFGGGSLACAAGLAAISTIRSDGLLENAAARGRQLQEGLSRLVSESEVLKEARGRGLLLGLEFQPLPDEISAAWKAVDESGLMPFLVPKLDDLIDNIPALYAMQVLLDAHGIYTQVARSNPLVLRIQPPLTITEEQVEHFLMALERVTSEWELGTHVMSTVISKSVIGHHDAAGRHRGTVKAK